MGSGKLFITPLHRQKLLSLEIVGIDFVCYSKLRSSILVVRKSGCLQLPIVNK